MRLLNPAEHARALRFRQAADMRRYVVGRAALRLLLAGYTQSAPDQIALTTNTHGKPLLAGGELQFNLAHAGDLLVLVVACAGRVGIDLEDQRPVPSEQDAIIRQRFAPGEQAQYFALPAERRQQAFYHGWVCKEAFIKAEGSGVHFGLDRFEVSMNPDAPAALLAIRASTEAARAWKLHGFTLEGGAYRGCIALEQPAEGELRCWPSPWSLDLNKLAAC